MGRVPSLLSATHTVRCYPQVTPTVMQRLLQSQQEKQQQLLVATNRHIVCPQIDSTCGYAQVQQHDSPAAVSTTPTAFAICSDVWLRWCCGWNTCIPQR